jgi:hypothetical protein
MLGSITSLGERSRGRHWAVTYAWFVIGALAGGLVLAAALLAVRAAGSVLPPAAALAVGLAGGAALLGAAALGRTPPSLERQVDHRWLDEYRGWVVGVGFGFQLGTGVLTRIPSFALYLLFLCALLGAPPAALVAAGIVYGALRGLTAAPGGLVRSPRDLRRLATLIARYEPRAARAGRASDVAAAACVVAVLLVAATV